MYARWRRLEAKEIIPLADKHYDVDARGKTDARGTHGQQHDTRHQCRQLQTANTVLSGDDRKYGDDGTGQPGNLQTRVPPNSEVQIPATIARCTVPVRGDDDTGDDVAPEMRTCQ